MVRALASNTMLKVVVLHVFYVESRQWINCEKVISVNWNKIISRKILCKKVNFWVRWLFCITERTSRTIYILVTKIVYIAFNNDKEL